MGSHGRRRRTAKALGIATAAVLAAPAVASADGLIAAYDRYEVGKGFEIGLVNVGTGEQIAVPATVNTTADELHPTLSPDGRHLVFMRTQLQPKLNGDIVPPAARSLLSLDRETGTIATLRNEGAGPVLHDGTLSWGIRPEPAFAGQTLRMNFARRATFADSTLGGVTSELANMSAAPSLQTLETTHSAFVANSHTVNDNTLPRTLSARHLGIAYVDVNTGALINGQAHITSLRFNDSGFNIGSSKTFGSPGIPASHPVPRLGDDYVAFDLANASDVDIHSLSYPTESTSTVAPAPITTTDAERMPAWSPPLGNQLGFVRTTAGRRTLVVFDLTPGIQNALNPPIDIGADAPTPQTRAYQSTWGGLSLALAPVEDVPTTTCSTSCVSVLANRALSSVVLRPRVSLTTRGQKIGIFVARVTGRRTLLGRSVPRIRPVGRVPLGRTRKGLNSFRWNGKVAGRRLKPGTYLLTYRALKRDRILSTSGSIRLTVTKDGTVRRVRRLR